MPMAGLGSCSRLFTLSAMAAHVDSGAGLWKVVTMLP